MHAGEVTSPMADDETSTSSAYTPSLNSFEVEEGKGERDDALLRDDGSSHKGGHGNCVRKQCAGGGTCVMLACVFFGAIVGLIVNVSVTDREVLAFWLGFPGSLFLRALKCLVTPMIFCNMVVGVAELAGLGKTGKLFSRTFGLYMLTTFIASIEGLIFVSIFQGLFTDAVPKATKGDLEVALKCPGGGFVSLSTDTEGMLCEAGNNGDPFSNQTFDMMDLNSVLVTNRLEGRTISETIASIFESLVPENIFNACVTPDILSVITFAIFFGCMIAKIDLKGERNYVMLFMDQLNVLLMDMVKYVIGFAPGGIFFMIAGAIANSDDFVDLLKNVGVLVMTVVLGLLFHVGFSLCSIFFCLTRRNPFQWLQKNTNQIFFAFSSASSAATLPITLDSIAATGEVPTSVRRFVCSLGATINMDGSGIYFPCAVVFMAYMSGNSAAITSGALTTLAIVSTLGAVGAVS